jgi:hypothetical protein
LNKVARIPLLDMGEATHALFKDGTKIEKIICCKLLDAHQEETKEYFIANEAIIPGVYQRTIYKKGPKESERIGALMIDIENGMYVLKLGNPMDRPAGIDFHITVQTTTQESTCLNSQSEECQSTKAVA